jgi:hypothetical protein
LHHLSSSPVGKGVTAGSETAIAATVARRSGKRITAESFKILTARLKSGQSAALAGTPPDLHLSAAAAGAAGIPDITSVETIALPDFSPSPDLAGKHGQGQTALPDAPAMAETDAGEFPVPGRDDPIATNPDVPATRAVLPQFRPLDWQSPAPAAGTLEEPAVEPEFVLTAAGASPAAAVPEPQVPETMPEIAAEEGEWPVETEVLRALEETQTSNIDAATESDPEAACEPIAAEVQDPAAEPEPPETQQGGTPPPVVAAMPVLEQLAADEAAVAPELEAESAVETKSPSSELAGRVVDAMIKTISTAIYAKPSASERAAFLRDVANLAGEAGEDVSSAAVDAMAIEGKPAPIISVAAASIGPVAGSVTEAIAERLGPAPLLRASTSAQPDDPFATSALPPRLADPKPAETEDADEESGDLALTLLDMMSGGTGSLPHERTLAADTLLRILPRIPVRQLISVVERVAIMEQPPALLVAKLIRDSRPEVVGPLLERCSHISDQDLVNAAPDSDSVKLRMLARRRVLSTVLSDFLIETGETSVLLTLIRNPGAALSHEAFFKLAECAAKHHALLAPLATRADLPPPVAFELFWHVPQELRRFIFSRFLTDSETLNKILRITLATHGNVGGDAMGEGKFPPREAVDNAIALAAMFKREQAAQAFADMGGIAAETAARILADPDGEPLTVLLKALGCSRARFEEAIAKLQLGEDGMISPDRNPDELQAIFEGLSFNKARILLTYWDWFIRKAGPYAPHN